MGRTYFIDGQFGIMGYMLQCRKCGRKIVVETVLNGTNHNLAVHVTCAECMEIDEEHPEIIKQVADFLKE